MGLRKERNQVRRHHVAFYTNDSVKNWIDDSRGFEKQSSFIHRKLEKIKRLEEDPDG